MIEAEGPRRAPSGAPLAGFLAWTFAAIAAMAAAVSVSAAEPPAEGASGAIEVEANFPTTARIQVLHDTLSGIRPLEPEADPPEIVLAWNPGPGSTAAAFAAIQEPVPSGPEVRRRDGMFFRSWLTVTSVELGLLCATAALPKSWTGWSANFVQEGANHFGEAYSAPPVWDTDRWYHNYLGHPYGGSVYYNTIRSQGGTKTESFLFGALLSTQWEYLFEAVAERPSIQDLIVTPISGRLLGELIHRMTQSMTKGGTNPLEKIAITVLNPMYVLYQGF